MEAAIGTDALEPNGPQESLAFELVSFVKKEAKI